MPIGLRTARAILIVLGAVLFSGSSFAAGPSYEDFVTQLKAGKLDIDYTAFRLSYAASPKYEPYGIATAGLANAMKTAFNAGDCATAMARAKDIMEANFVQIDAHFVTGLCHKKAGNEEGARQERAVTDGLINSVLKSGDGKSPQTAFVVISIDEEYKALAAMGLVLNRQSLVVLQGLSFDRMEAKTRDGGQAVTLYFNIDRMRAQMMRELQPKQ
jgi:Domain of unknown function (DUF4919)